MPGKAHLACKNCDLPCPKVLLKTSALDLTHTQPFLQPFFMDYLGELVPEEISFWTLFCKER